LELLRKVICYVPTLRFKKYNIKWDKKLLSDFAKKITKKNSNNVIKNVICNSAQNGLIPQLDFFDKEIANNENTAGYYIINNGDFVYNPRKSLSAPYGPVNIYKYDKAGIVSPLYLCFSVEGIDKKYLLQRFKSNCWHRYIYLNGDSGARHDRVSIKDDVFLSQPIYVPSMAEQADIANFLEIIDKRINVQNKIISKYESLIKGIEDSVLSVFESVEYQLGDLVQIVKGQQINGLQLESTGDYYYLNGGISPSGYVNKYNAEENTISISEGGNSCGFVRFNTEKFWSGGHCYTLKIKNAFCCVKYLFYYLKSNEKDIMQLRVGSGLPNIQKGSLAGFPVKLPRLQMQQSIVRVLDALTNKKEIEIALLKQLQSQKTYLLSKMFI